MHIFYAVLAGLDSVFFIQVFSVLESGAYGVLSQLLIRGLRFMRCDQHAAKTAIADIITHERGCYPKNYPNNYPNNASSSAVKSRYSPSAKSAANIKPPICSRCSFSTLLPIAANIRLT